MNAIPARKLVLAGLLAASVLLAIAFDTAPWRYRAAVRVLERGRLCVLPIERTLYVRMRQDLADLRIVREGQEIPYVIETVAGALEEHECRPEVMNQSAIPDTGVQVTLDLAKCKGDPKHSRLRLTTAETNFRQRVRIETSDDNRFWNIVREDGYIFDFTQGDRKLSVLTVDYPVSTRRYVRATVFGWTSPGAISGAWSLYRLERPAELYTIDAQNPARAEDAETRSSILSLDLGQSGLPHSQVRLEADNSSFHRAVELEASDDNKSWRMVARSALFQIADEKSLAIPYAERHERYLRIRIFNGDNRAVPVQRVYVETLKRLVKFQPPFDGDFWMYYGNPGARPPMYDLAVILSRQTPSLETTPLVAEWQLNPAYRPPPEPGRPWSERNPALLYGVLATAIVVMGFVTVRFLIKVRGA
jgi:hypothetical protein